MAVSFRDARGGVVKRPVADPEVALPRQEVPAQGRRSRHRDERILRTIVERQPP